MKKFTHTDQYLSMPLEVANDLREALQDEEGDFDHLLGGEIFVIEDILEVAEITFGDGNNATQKADSMDVATVINNYAKFFLATNNAGGNAWYVPMDIVRVCPLLEATIAMTEQYWTTEQGVYA